MGKGRAVMTRNTHRATPEEIAAHEALIKEYQEEEYGSMVEGFDSSGEKVTWVKDWGDLWSSGTGMRVNSAALPGWTKPPKQQVKLPKGVSEGSPSLFG